MVPKISKRVQKSTLGHQNWRQMGTRGAIEEQDGAKRGHEEPRMRPRWVKMGPRWHKMIPRGPQDDPKRPQEAPKRVPKASQMDQDGVQKVPKGSR